MASKKYTPYTWENGEYGADGKMYGTTPTSASNFNHMEQGISTNDDRITVIEQKIEDGDLGGGSGDGTSITVDSELSSTSENPVQNKVINAELNSLKENIANKQNSLNRGDITNPLLADLSVSTAKIQKNAVTQEKIANEVTLKNPNSVSFTKMSYSNGSYSTTTVSYDGSEVVKNGTDTDPMLLKSAVVQLIKDNAGSSSGGGDTIDVDTELKEYMTAVKPSIKLAIINKGGTVEDTDSFADYSTRISEIPNGVSAAQTLPAQTTLTATELSSGGIKLNWKDVNADGYLIVRKANTTPTTSADGTIIYNGEWVDGYTDSTATVGNTYVYRIFPRNSVNQYQATEEGSIVSVAYKDRTGQVKIEDLSLGDTIKFGSWGSSEFTWKIVDTLDKSEGYVTMACDNYYGTGILQYDAPENDSTNPNPVTNRKNQGNNRWAYSNARQVLNSDGAASSWFEAQHDYDVRPSYYNQNALMYNWTDYEKNIIVSKTNICGLDTNDGGGSETVVDKVWLPSAFAMGLEISQVKEDDHVYEVFTDNTSRTFQNNYWLRTINNLQQGSTPNTGSGVRYVRSSGSLSYDTANYNVSLRPFCLLPTSAYVTWSDSDQVYVLSDDTERNA